MCSSSTYIEKGFVSCIAMELKLIGTFFFFFFAGAFSIVTPMDGPRLSKVKTKCLYPDLEGCNEIPVADYWAYTCTLIM